MSTFFTYSLLICGALFAFPGSGESAEFVHQRGSTLTEGTRAVLEEVLTEHASLTDEQLHLWFFKEKTTPARLEELARDVHITTGTRNRKIAVLGFSTQDKSVTFFGEYGLAAMIDANQVASIEDALAEGWQKHSLEWAAVEGVNVLLTTLESPLLTDNRLNKKLDSISIESQWEAPHGMPTFSAVSGWMLFLGFGACALALILIVLPFLFQEKVITSQGTFSVHPIKFRLHLLSGRPIGHIQNSQTQLSRVSEALRSLEMNHQIRILVHTSTAPWGRSPLVKSKKLLSVFPEFDGALFINARLRNAGFSSGKSLQTLAPAPFWSRFTPFIQEELYSTHHENAAATALQTLMQLRPVQAQRT